MGKKSRHPRRQKDPEHDLEKDEVVDQDDEEFFLDEIDKFHADKEKILLKDAGTVGRDVGMENEEVLAVESDEEDDSDEEEWQDSSSDEEVRPNKEKDDDGILSRKAWGKKRSAFYGGDDFKGLEGSDREEAEMVEEQEVLAIQKRLAEQIDEDDIGLDLLQDDGDVPKKDEESLSRIKADLSSLSVKAQWKLAKKEAPELDGLIKDFKTKLEELKNQVHPLMELVKCGRIPEGHGRDYVILRYRVYLSYLLNISFYLALKAKKLPIHNHPVVSRLVQYRTVINQLAPIDKKLQRKIQEVLEDSDVDEPESSHTTDRVTADVEMDHSDGEGVPLPKKAKRVPSDDVDAQNEKVALDYYKSLSEKLQEQTENREEKASDEPEEDGAVEERRAINYEIAKNKGLRQKKKKIDRNPRVKMRQKYKKAKIRRKGQVREYRPEINKYAGEPTGIRIGLRKSIPLQ